jgi:adiponectin receptor
MYELQMYPFWLGVISYIMGSVIMVVKVPERWLPGKFCYLGASHQIHHFCVLFGGFIQLWANFRLYH